MFYPITKTTSLSLAISLGLMVTATKAQAFTFNVSYDVLNGTHMAEGTIEIKDSALSSKATDLVESDFEDWNIVLTNNSGTATTTLTSDNSSIRLFPDSPSGIKGTKDGVTFANKREFKLGINNDDLIRLTKNGRGVHLNGTEIFVPLNQDTLRAPAVALSGTPVSTPSGITVPTPDGAPAVAVPFGVSSDMGIVILAGLYGASRLRKKISSC